MAIEVRYILLNGDQLGAYYFKIIEEAKLNVTAQSRHSNCGWNQGETIFFHSRLLRLGLEPATDLKAVLK